ncbi:MAG: thioredoxin [Oscillospiraceae bacterium]|nr:thioredoxin [Oscillospiraceae bacterium]
MAIAHLTQGNFESTVNEGTVLIDFWATWCGPCRMQAPILEQLDEELGGSVKICKVDVDEEPNLARRFRILSIPTLVVMKDGKVTATRVGVQSVDNLKDMLA